MSGDRIGDRARLPVDGLQLLGAGRRGCRQGAAVSAQDRGHVVIAHQPVHGGARLLRRCRVDHLQSHLAPGHAERRLHAVKLLLPALSLRTAERVDRA